MMNIKTVMFSLVASLLMVAQAGIHDEPDGASVKLTADGGFQVMAIASGDYQFNNPTAIRLARAAAEKRAKAVLAKFMKEDLATKEGMEEASKNTLKAVSDGQTESTQATMESVSSTLETIHTSAAALLSGVVVLEDEKIPGGGVGGSYRVKVGISSKTLKVSGMLGKAVPQAPAGAPATPVVGSASGVASGVSADGISVAAAAAGGAAIPVPEGWIVCVGVGSDRKRAVQAALVEGVSQVYGEQLKNDERLTERMTSLQANANVMGKMLETATMVDQQQSVSDTTTKTAGFVREFRVIKVVPKDGSQEATVYANIVNPRAGGAVALLVKTPTMTIEDRTTVYQLGPKVRMSGAEIANAIKFELPNGLEKANKFLILNDKSLITAIKNQNLTQAMVKTGIANAGELMQCGQGITPDYTLDTVVQDVKYSKKLGQDKKTKKFGTVYKMSIKLKVALVNARLGRQVKSDVITLALDNDEIKGLLKEDEDVDLVQAVLSKLAEPLEQWIGNVKL